MALNQGQNLYRIYKDATARNSVTTNPAKDNSGVYIYNATDVLEVVYRNQVSTPTDVTMTKIDRSTYQALANKESEGTPSQFFIQRFRDYTDITVYMTPSSSTNKFLNFYYIKEFKIREYMLIIPTLHIDSYHVWFQD